MTTMQRTALKDRKLPNYSFSEELFNMISHIVGAAFGIVGFFIMVGKATWNHDVWGIVSGAVYGVMMTLLYTMSSIYHGLRPGLAKKVFQVLDHCSVFLLIAGTYTPFLLKDLRVAYPRLAWIMFGVIWGFAVLGIVLNAIDLKMFRYFSMACYLGMGWAAVVVIRPMIEVYGTRPMWWLLGGGLAYTVGAIVYMIGKKHGTHYMHAVFHVFCLIGSVFHFLAIVLYVI